jgi:hypothetical protein
VGAWYLQKVLFGKYRDFLMIKLVTF